MVALLSFFFFFFPKWCLQILAAWLLVLLTISTLCQCWFGQQGGAVGYVDAMMGLSFSHALLFCFVTLLCYFALPPLPQQTPLGSREESRFRSELRADNLYDPETWPQISICIQLAIRAKATQRWFAKNRRRNDGLETGRGMHKITARQRQALP